MSFRQPAPGTIRSYHFKENVYPFPVESVLESDPGPVGVQITATAGYLLTGSSSKAPQSELTLHYVKQDDGSYVARDTITLLVPGPAFLSGAIKLRDPLGEVMTLPVHIDTMLTVDDSPILFNEIEPGTEAFAIVKIAQYGTDTPVVVSIEGSAYFTLAPGRTAPALTTTLTLTPMYSGTYIYVRYAPEKIGRHMATLQVHTPYRQEFILLEGRSIWLSGWYRMPQRLAFRTMLEVQDRLPFVTKAQKAGIGAALGLAVLATGYLYRCELIPSLCQSETVQTNTTTLNSGLAGVDSSQTEKYGIGEAIPLSLPKSEEYPWIGSGDNAGETPKPSDSLTARPNRRGRMLPPTKPVDTVEKDSIPAAVPRPAEPVIRAAQDSVSAIKPPKRKRRSLYPVKALATATQESDLEKELNRKPNRLP
ncbi:hypothetical protein [Larkinella arboricola]